MAAEVAGRLEAYFKLIPPGVGAELPLGITRYAGQLIQRYDGKDADTDFQIEVGSRVEDL